MGPAHENRRQDKLKFQITTKVIALKGQYLYLKEVTITKLKWYQIKPKQDKVVLHKKVIILTLMRLCNNSTKAAEKAKFKNMFIAESD